MRQTRRGYYRRDVTKPYYEYRNNNRKHCKCCNRERNADEQFSNSGQCESCGEANLVASLMGMPVSEHWELADNGDRVNHHAVLLDNIT